MPKTKNANTRKRLTPQQKSAIAAAGLDVTNVALAEKYGTTGATIAKYRNGGAAAAKAMPQTEATAPAVGRGRGRKTMTTAPVGSSRAEKTVNIQVDGSDLVLRMPKNSALARELVDRLLS